MENFIFCAVNVAISITGAIRRVSQVEIYGKLGLDP